jgi:hypothetical protein
MNCLNSIPKNYFNDPEEKSRVACFVLGCCEKLCTLASQLALVYCTFLNNRACPEFLQMNGLAAGTLMCFVV